ncbi:homocysteine S-methyltransferase [Nostocoides sp. F2B08]|uniref:homocysteine S-methyltransferase n=1 Tax=Nostocoides sp. F2B08 TaxID=2653936 RepID=UPI001D048E93|nr:homocysteine S-methyltransferase [Tetrasphaera sp. F2B08]
MDDLNDLAERFSRSITVLDGGLATELEAQGYDLSGALWSARLLADEPEAITAAHKAFFEAGAHVAITASYQASFEGFERAGLSREKAATLIRRSVSLAMAARDEVRPEDGLVAASVGPYGAALADGSEYRGDYGLTAAELRQFHRPRLEVLATTGSDLFAIETIPCLAEVEALCAEISGTGHAAWLSLSTKGGRTCADESLEEAFAMAAEVDEIIAVGVNCCSPEDVLPGLEVARRVTDKPLVAYPNSGRTWDPRSRTWVGEPTFTLPMMGMWRRAGAKAIGGCCGVSPADIATLSACLQKSAPRWVRSRPVRARAEVGPFG